MQIHQLKKNNKAKTKKRVGRGGKRGKTAGRGHKGQKARAGHRIRPEIRDAIKKIPKLRGHGKNRARTVNSSVIKPIPINLFAIEKIFSDKDNVNPNTLVMKGLILRKKGKLPAVKILGTGAISKKITISGCLVSKNAKILIEKVGGKVVFLNASK